MRYTMMVHMAAAVLVASVLVGNVSSAQTTKPVEKKEVTAAKKSMREHPRKAKSNAAMEKKEVSVKSAPEKTKEKPK